jgi:hypothetical protein
MRLTIILGLRFLKRAGGGSKFFVSFGIFWEGSQKSEEGKLHSPAGIIRAIQTDQVPDANPPDETAPNSAVTNSIE